MPEALLTPLLEAQDRITTGRAVEEDDLHVTLVFLEDVAEAALAEADLALQDMALPRVPLTLRGLQIFGATQTVVAADVAMSEEMERVQRGVLKALRGAGVIPPRARLRPHITLRRLKRGQSPGAPKDAALVGAAVADRLNLWESRLRPDGARYDVLAEYPLR